jgi:hypothetical protein
MVFFTSSSSIISLSQRVFIGIILHRIGFIFSLNSELNLDVLREKIANTDKTHRAERIGR